MESGELNPTAAAEKEENNNSIENLNLNNGGEIGDSEMNKEETFGRLISLDSKGTVASSI